jgi:futalosine hydrolase
MKILVVSATEHELNLSNTNLQNNKPDDNVDILISGIGIASTVYHVTKTLMQKNYNMVIQAGIAGSFTNNLNLGETVFVSSDTFGDSGIEEVGSFKTLFASGLVNENDFPFTNGWLVNPHKILNNGLIKTVKAITVNKITDDKKQIDEQINFFNAQVESMEGAAFHYVCLSMNIPFLQLRGISNVVGERDKNKWEMKEAISSLNDNLNKIIQVLSQ